MSRIFPNLQVNRVTLDDVNGELDVSIDFSLKFDEDPAASAGILRQCGIYQDFRALVVQMTDKDLEQYLMRLSSAARASYIMTHYKQPDFNTNPVGLHDTHTGQGSGESQSGGDRGYRTFSLINPVLTEIDNQFEISFHTDKSFRLPSEDLRHLSYIFLMYIEDDQLDYPRISTPVIEKVIVEKNVVDKAYEYRTLVKDTTGDLWPGDIYKGPVHEDPNNEGQWMAGADHTAVPHDMLQRTEVSNTTIHDLRLFKQLANVTYVFDHDSPTNISYFSDIFLSRDPSGTSRYSFTIDFAKMVEHGSKHMWLFRNTDLFESLKQNAKIESIKLLRKRIRDVGTGEGGEEEPTVIADSADPAPGQPLTDGSFVIEPHEGEPYEVGNIKETDFAHTTPGLRSFSGVDFSMMDSNFGNYQYGAEINVTDVSATTLAEKQNTLATIMGGFEDYSALAPNYYNNDIRRFTGWPMDIGWALFFGALHESIANYLAILALTTDNTLPTTPNLREKIWNMIGPDNGTPENILRFLNTMGVLNVQFEDLTATTTQAAQDGGDASTGNSKNTSLGTTGVFSKWFDDLFDNTKRRFYGYNFHSAASTSEAGHIIQSWPSYENYIMDLASQYFTVSAISLGGEVLNLQVNKYEFLTPTRLITGKDASIDLATTAEDFYDYNKYNDILVNLFTDFNQEYYTQQGITFESVEETEEEEETSVVDEDDNAITEEDFDQSQTKQNQADTEGISDSNEALFTLLEGAMGINLHNYNMASINMHIEDINEQLPNQIKALILLSSPGPWQSSLATSAPRVVDAKIAGEKIAGFLYINFLNIMRVHVLTGFQDGNVSQPIFEPLSEVLIGQPSKTSLCRLTRYTDPFRPSIDDKIPVYHEYFSLTPPPAGWADQLAQLTAEASRQALEAQEAANAAAKAQLAADQEAADAAALAAQEAADAAAEAALAAQEAADAAAEAAAQEAEEAAAQLAADIAQKALEESAADIAAAEAEAAVEAYERAIKDAQDASSAYQKACRPVKGVCTGDAHKLLKLQNRETNAWAKVADHEAELKALGLWPI